MIKTYGDFIEEPDSEQEYLAIGFSPSSIPLKQRWRNNGLSADFLADYLSTFFPSSDSESTELSRHEQIKGAVSYIANELLENAMKFNQEVQPRSINVRLNLHEDRLSFFVTNSITPEQMETLLHYIEELLSTDPQEMYIRKLEYNAIQEELECSGLGLLTMINDYSAKLGWKFETVSTQPSIILVTTRVELAV